METQTPTEQAPAASVEDRIASIFGSEPTEAPAQDEPAQPEETEAASEEATEAAPTAADTFELEIDGEKFQLPKKLEKAVMQERDYTQKAQTLAEQRRSLELQQHQQRIAAMSEGFHKEAATELRDIEMIDAVIKQATSQDVSGFDLDRLIRHRMDIDSLKERKSALQQSVDAKRQDWGQKQAAEIAKLRTQSLETIQKRIPGFNKDVAKEIRDHALSEGYSDEELNSILDPRHAVTLWKAQQFDKLKASAQKSVAQAKTVKTTSSTPMPQQVKDKLAFRKEVSKHKPGSAEFKRAVEGRVAKIFG